MINLPSTDIIRNMTTDKISSLYLIRLKGTLNAEWALWFPELSLKFEVDGNTLLRGELPDQAALMGVLFRIHNLNLLILSVIHSS